MCRCINLLVCPLAYTQWKSWHRPDTIHSWWPSVWNNITSRASLYKSSSIEFFFLRIICRYFSMVPSVILVAFNLCVIPPFLLLKSENIWTASDYLRWFLSYSWYVICAEERAKPSAYIATPRHLPLFPNRGFKYPLVFHVCQSRCLVLCLCGV
jgi:hypothetical protein